MPYTRLRHFLNQRGGAASFAEFMAAALYDPAQGYYSAHIATVGRGGDFATAATLSPWLGQAVAGWWRELGKPRSLIEVGPGTGALAEALLQALTWWERRSVRLTLVETSPTLRTQQQTRLGKGRGVRWAESVGAALAESGAAAAIFSNELVDAFPVVLAEWRAGAWHEVWVEITPEGRLVETLRPLPHGLSSVALETAWAPLEGQRVEIPQRYRAWLGDWSAAAVGAHLLTIDYGGNFPDLYTRRPAGSLRGYLRHQRQEGPAIYANMGRQDLTADVCFDDLERWGQEYGWSTTWQGSQAAFLQRYAPPRPPTREDAYLLREDGAGGAFRVLMQRQEGQHGQEGHIS